MYIDVMNGHSQGFLYLVAHRVGDTIRHRGDACTILDDDMDINIHFITIVADRDAARRFASDVAARPSARFFGASPTTP